MAGKVFAAVTVAFWAAMMAALVRVEILPRPLPLEAVPTERVLRKLFANPVPARLKVYYKGAEIGSWRVEISPAAERGPLGDGAGQVPAGAYEVSSSLWLRLSVFGIPSQLQLRSVSVFNERYEMERIHARTTVGGSRVEVAGDVRTRKVRVSFDVGEMRDLREFDFSQMQGAELAGALGMPALANFSFLGAGGVPGAFGAPVAAQVRARPVTTVHLDRFSVAGGWVRAYLVESGLDDSMWARMWVSEMGEVLRVETSLGLTMLSELLADGADAEERRAMISRAGGGGWRR
jgi:hypothetical protein